MPHWLESLLPRRKEKPQFITITPLLEEERRTPLSYQEQLEEQKPWEIALCPEESSDGRTVHCKVKVGSQVSFAGELSIIPEGRVVLRFITDHPWQAMPSGLLYQRPNIQRGMRWTWWHPVGLNPNLVEIRQDPEKSLDISRDSEFGNAALGFAMALEEMSGGQITISPVIMEE